MHVRKPKITLRLEEKLEILTEWDAGVPRFALAKKFRVNVTTISHIVKNCKQITDSNKCI